MKNKEIQELVQNEIKNNMMDLDEWRINNLQQILFELKQLEKNPTYVLSYPRYIIDQWEFDNPLIVKLFRIFRRYRKNAISSQINPSLSKFRLTIYILMNHKKTVTIKLRSDFLYSIASHFEQLLRLFFLKSLPNFVPVANFNRL